MFERFTDRARTVMILARTTAAARGDQIRPVYLLHALTSADGVAARALAGLGVDASLATGVSNRSAGARALCLHLMTIPPRTRGVPHRHGGHESAIYTVSGETEVWHGEGLRQRTVLRAGDFMYVPPGIPHLPVNRSDVMTVAVVAGTDPQEPESVVTMTLPPHLAELGDYPVASP